MKNKSKKAMLVAGGIALSMAAGLALGCMCSKMKNKKNVIMEEM